MNGLQDAEPRTRRAEGLGGGSSRSLELARRAAVCRPPELASTGPGDRESSHAAVGEVTASALSSNTRGQCLEVAR